MNYILLWVIIVLVNKVKEENVVMVSVFRHSNRTNYIDFSNNKHNKPFLLKEGFEFAYQSGKKMKDEFKIKENIMPNNTKCYTTTKPRAIQSLTLRIAGINNNRTIIDNAYKNVDNISYYNEMNNKYCTFIEQNEYLFPSKKCDKKLQSILLENKDFISYSSAILKQLKEIDTFRRYYNSKKAYYTNRDNSSPYHKLYLIADYLDKTKEKLSTEEVKMFSLLKGYNRRYLDALTSHASIIKLIVNTFYDIIFDSFSQAIESNGNYNILLFSTHEIDLMSLIKSLELPFESFLFDYNDSINFILNKEGYEYYITIYYNTTPIKIKNCDIKCPYNTFKTLLNSYHRLSKNTLTSLCALKQTISYNIKDEI